MLETKEISNAVWVQLTSAGDDKNMPVFINLENVTRMVARSPGSLGCSGHTLLNEFRYRNIHVAGKWMGPHM